MTRFWVALRAVFVCALLLVMAASATASNVAPPEPPEEETAWARILDLRHQKQTEEALRAVETLLATKLARKAPEHEIATAKQYIRSLEAILALSDTDRARAAWADSLRPVIQGLIGKGASARAESLLQRQLAVRRELLPGAYLEHSESLANLGNVLRAEGRLTDAEAPILEAIAIWRELLGPRHPYVASGYSLLGSLRAQQGRHEESLRLVRLGLSMYRATWGDQHPAVSRSWHELAVLLSEVGEHEEAIGIHQDNLAVREALFGEESVEAAATLNQLGQELVELDALDEAAEAFARALAIRETKLGPKHPMTLVVRASLGELERRRGDLDRAERLLTEVLEARREALGPKHPHVARSLLALSRVHRTRGALDAAAAEAAEATRILTASLGPEHPEVATSLRSQADAAVASGDRESALKWMEEAARVYETTRVRSGAGWTRATFGASPYPFLAQLLLESGRGDEAWRAVERGTARVLADLLQAAGDSLAPRMAEREVLDRQARRVRELERSAGADASLAVAAATARAELLQAEYRFFSLAPDPRAAVAAGGVLDLVAVQSKLPDDAAILGWLESEGAAWCYAIRSRGAVRWERAASDPTEAVSSFRELLRSAAGWPFRVTDTARVDSLAHEVWRQRFAPLEPHLDGVEALLIVPSGGLQGAPIEALVDPAGEPLAARYRITYAPSATVGVWLSRTKLPPDPLARPSLLVGDPAPFDLPGSREEIASLRVELPRATVLSGETASDSVLRGMATRGELRKFGLLHIATHAVIDPRSLLGSALVLDEPVTAAEILQHWSLDADLVVLSGCSTGLGRRVPGEGFVGFVQTFLQVGARSVLASLWDVDDRATALLMQHFYRSLQRDPASIAEALRAARQALRTHVDVQGERPFRHPAYWAGFVLVAPVE